MFHNNLPCDPANTRFVILSISEIWHGLCIGGHPRFDEIAKPRLKKSFLSLNIFLHLPPTWTKMYHYSNLYPFLPKMKSDCIHLLYISCDWSPNMRKYFMTNSNETSLHHYILNMCSRNSSKLLFSTWLLYYLLIKDRKT
jgi:hypothetical protein